MPSPLPTNAVNILTSPQAQVLGTLLALQKKYTQRPGGGFDPDDVSLASGLGTELCESTLRELYDLTLVASLDAPDNASWPTHYLAR